MKISDILQGGKVLFVGNEDEAFSDKAFMHGDSFQVISLGEPLNQLKGKEFHLICMQMTKPLKVFISYAKDLKTKFPEARFILLVRMSEEISGAELAAQNEVFDEYLLYPARSKEIFDHLFASDIFDLDVKWSGEADKIKELIRMATEDELTGLKNRRYIMEFTRQIIEYAKLEEGRVTLLLFDIDDFKDYNDLYGHAAGDEILQEAAVVMKNCCRATDVVGRIGGDEFVVIFWDDLKMRKQRSMERREQESEPPDEAIFIANRFRKEINKAELSSLGKEGKGVLTISGGLASFPRDASNSEELFEKADKALYDAKKSGKNRIYLVGSAQRDISKIK